MEKAPTLIELIVFITIVVLIATMVFVIVCEPKKYDKECAMNNIKEIGEFQEDCIKSFSSQECKVMAYKKYNCLIEE